MASEQTPGYTAALVAISYCFEKDPEKLVPDMEVWSVREGVAAYLDGSWTPADGRYGD